MQWLSEMAGMPCERCLLHTSAQRWRSSIGFDDLIGGRDERLDPVTPKR
jgi:hypothetical protein